jgi:hypothetical protein
VKKVCIQVSLLPKELGSFLPLINVEECFLTSLSFSNLSFCSTVKKLTIASNGNVSCLDFSPLIQLEELFCDSHRMVNYDHLSNLKKLTLRPVQSLVDASCFAHVSYLKFESCPNLTEVSCLGENVVYLSFNRCPMISDISSLGKIPTLLFDHCPGVTDVSALGERTHSFTMVKW